MELTKVKTFFVNHFEKMILAGIVGASGYLIFQGLRLEHITDKHDPSTLADRANQVKRQIDDDRTEAIIEGRESTFDVEEQVNKLRSSVVGSPYKPSKLLIPIPANTIVKRQDPQLKAPLEINLTPVTAIIAYQNLKSKDPDDYPLRSLPGADALDGDGARSKTKRQAGLSALGGIAEPQGLFDERADEDDEDEVVSRGAGRRFNSKHDFGVTAKAIDGRPPIPKLARFIAGAAVVPHEKIFEAYELALANTDSYSPDRDTPLYVNFEVQRAELTGKTVDQLTEEDWLLVWTRRYYESVAERRWAGVAPDIVPQEYRDDRLSNWIPPVLLDDFTTFVKHPLIPMVSPDELEEDDEENEDDEIVRPGDLFSEEANPAEDFKSRRRGRGMSALGSNALGERGSSMNRFSSNDGDEENPVQYKLLRFYDFLTEGPRQPKQGIRYVYRVRFSVEDPNFPLNEDDAPAPRSLAPEVEKRVLALMDEYAKTRKRRFQRWSPWSEPSEPVIFPSLNQQFVGPVERGSVYDWTVAGKPVRYARSRPTGKVVTAQFDPDYDVRIPFLMEVSEGSVLSHQGDAEVVDPITLDIKKMEDAKVNSSTTVVDIDGGTPLGLIEDMNQPGMMLLTDEFGNLIVADEVNDLESFRIYSFADEREDD